MAKKENKKTVRVIKTTNNYNQDTNSTSEKKVVPTSSTVTSSSKRRSAAIGNSENMIFGLENYKIMIAGLALVILGFILMSGGTQPDDAWNPDEIYSLRRTLVAPFLILVGLVVEIFAIFKK